MFGRKFTLQIVIKKCRAFSSSTNASLSELARKSLEFSENEGFVMKSPYKRLDMPTLSIDQYIWKDISNWSNHIAIACGATGREYTYSKFRDHCAAFAIRLRNAIKLTSNDDVIAICLPNVPEFLITFLGSMEAAVTVTTVNPWYTSEEISRQLMSSQPKVIVCLVENVETIKVACNLAKQPNIKVIGVKTTPKQSMPNDVIDFNEIMSIDGINLSDASKFHEKTDYDRTTLLLYSSGTTGLPKGVMLSHRNLTSNCTALNGNLPNQPLLLPTTNDYQEVLPQFLPFYHIYGLMPATLSKLARGVKIVSIPKYDANDFLRIVRQYKATYLHLVPPTVIQLGNRTDLKTTDFQYVRCVMSAASNLAQADAEKFKQYAPNSQFFQGYGLTETSPLATLTPQGLTNYATIGWPIANTEMKIVAVDDEQQKGLPANQLGELWCRGHNVMQGYYKNDEATKAMITSNGWLRTGDIGHFDDMGLFYVSDRIKELIKVNANQVAPAELEGILREHKDVLDAVVIGIPHPKCGEVPKAFVILRQNAKVTESDLQEFVAKKVIRYKQLSGGVQFVDFIPKTATGKIQRKEIRKLFG